MAWFGDWLRKKEHDMSTGNPRCASPARVKDISAKDEKTFQIQLKSKF